MSLLADEQTQTDPARAIATARSGIRLASRIGFTKGLFENYFSLASAFQGQALFDSAVIYFHKALKTAVQRHDEAGQADACSSLGHSFMRKSQMDSARHYLDRGLIFARKIQNYRIEAGIYNNYGNVLLEENNYTPALDYFVQAARLYEHPLADRQGNAWHYPISETSNTGSAGAPRVGARYSNIR